MDGKVRVTEVAMKGKRQQSRNEKHRAQGYPPFMSASGSDFDVQVGHLPLLSHTILAGPSSIPIIIEHFRSH